MKSLKLALFLLVGICASKIANAQAELLNLSSCSVKFDLTWQDPSTCSGTTTTSHTVIANSNLIVNPPAAGLVVTSVTYTYAGQPSVTMQTSFCSGSPSPGYGFSPASGCGGQATQVEWYDFPSSTPVFQEFKAN